MTRSHTIQGNGSQYLNKLNTELSIHLVQNSNEGMIYLNPYAKDGMNHQGAQACSFVLNPKVALAGWKGHLMPPYPWPLSWGTSHNFSPSFSRKKDSDNLFSAKCQSESAEMLSCCTGVRIKTRLWPLGEGLARTYFSSVFLPHMGITHDRH